MEGYNFKVINDELSPGLHFPSCSPVKHIVKDASIPLPQTKDTNTAKTITEAQEENQRFTLKNRENRCLFVCFLCFLCVHVGASYRMLPAIEK